MWYYSLWYGIHLRHNLRSTRMEHSPPVLTDEFYELIWMFAGNQRFFTYAVFDWYKRGSYQPIEDEL